MYIPFLIFSILVIFLVIYRVSKIPLEYNKNQPKFPLNISKRSIEIVIDNQDKLDDVLAVLTKYNEGIQGHLAATRKFEGKFRLEYNGFYNFWYPSPFKKHQYTSEPIELSIKQLEEFLKPNN
jgi:hypothetical protein